ncbi:Transient receptor potential channel, partial [Trinorchestia longiramus]
MWNNVSHSTGHSRSASKVSEGATSRASATAAGLVLTPEERTYLLYVQRGDVASVKALLDNDRPPGYIFDIDCTDPIGRTAVTIAIENENIDLLEALLERGVQSKDALLQAIAEEYVEGVELLLHWEEKQHVPGEPYSWEMTENDTAVYTKDITPLILAAHRNHYEILKLLLDRGASLPMPHDVRCGCDSCIASTKEDSLRHSLSRINAYKALASPSLISLSSKDPILTAFELSAELSRLESMEHEFKAEYIKLQETVQEFCTRLLDQVSTHKELWTLLNYSSAEDDCDGGGANMEGDVCSLSRLKLAIKFSQKSFIAHSNVQQFLGNIWYNDLPGFRRLPDLSQLVTVLKLACSFPLLSFSYIVKPDSQRGMFAKKPFVKFISHCASYMFFLSLLTLASQRFEYLVIEMLGNEWLLSVLADWRRRERGSMPGPIELLIIFYVFGLIWTEVKALWTDGLLEYLHDLMNIVDFVTNSFFLAWIQLRVTAWILVHRDLWWYDKWPWYPREQWHAFDPMLLSEGCFGAAMIVSFLKLVNMFSVNHHLGPLQISLGRMIFDILKFFFLYMLVLFAFGCGLIQMLWYYADLEMHQCYHLPGGLPDYEKRESSCINWRRFANLFESSQSLFWASFGLVELEAFDLTGLGSFTRFWGLLMFGSYSLINIIVLLNLLIAMMSNSYQAISERADTEWKFARTKLWISYFEDGGTVPPPFNLIPTPKAIMQLLGKGHHMRGSLKDK